LAPTKAPTKSATDVTASVVTSVAISTVVTLPYTVQSFTPTAQAQYIAGVAAGVGRDDGSEAMD